MKIVSVISAHKYHTRNEFIADIELIANNCEQYNGNESNFTKQARLMVDFTKQALDEVNLPLKLISFRRCVRESFSVW